MKITLDLSKLVEEGKLTPAEAERLKALAAHETGSLGINILIGFGVVAVSAGMVALVPTPATGGGRRRDVRAWICADADAGRAMDAAVANLHRRRRADRRGRRNRAGRRLGRVAAAGDRRARRCRGGGAQQPVDGRGGAGARRKPRRASGYWHATYSLAIYEPVLTVVLFSALALVTYLRLHNSSAPIMSGWR